MQSIYHLPRSSGFICVMNNRQRWRIWCLSAINTFHHWVTCEAAEAAKSFLQNTSDPWNRTDRWYSCAPVISSEDQIKGNGDAIFLKKHFLVSFFLCILSSLWWVERRRKETRQVKETGMQLRELDSMMLRLERCGGQTICCRTQFYGSGCGLIVLMQNEFGMILMDNAVRHGQENKHLCCGGGALLLSLICLSCENVLLLPHDESCLLPKADFKHVQLQHAPACPHALII